MPLPAEAFLSLKRHWGRGGGFSPFSSVDHESSADIRYFSARAFVSYDFQLRDRDNTVILITDHGWIAEEEI